MNYNGIHRLAHTIFVQYLIYIFTYLLCRLIIYMGKQFRH